MKVGTLVIGEGRPAMVVAKIGVNHNGDLDLAKATIETAARAGADAVELHAIASDGSQSNGPSFESNAADGSNELPLTPRIRELTDAVLADLARHAFQAGIHFLVPARSLPALDPRVRAGATALIASPDLLTSFSLLELMAKAKLPTFVATGRAELAEIEAAVLAFRAGGGKDLLLLHGALGSPALPQEVHLRRMVGLRERFACDVGFSDYTEHGHASCMAAALGAAVIMRPFTLSRDLPGPFHRFSSDHEAFAALVKALHGAETTLGTRLPKPPVASDLGAAAMCLSCAASSDLPAGHVVRGADIKFVRLGSGVPPTEVGTLIGVKLVRALRRDEVFTAADFASAA